ncbi:MAG: bifunctional 4-hydroxy-2-oxoglutarate aldolase/2-dehydro-3-deoxy-phosphogluconate aldolase [Bacteroidetes bacterium]|jgi:2-dehydro-3-deoxyphosphogluconate aldolase/(4S)-4-hydroxy-2-oxoglutarate aldolase|nr:bifunctional 4-hydroxy-2-oxoglutarate aldolase/2-dehydro-3-deoxy-phosphogluconate aldolase [Bacteroidota bacterium]
MNSALSHLHLLGIIPVIAIDDAKNAVPLANALVEGGLPCAEITFRTSAAEASIAAIAKAFPDMALGAGTVLTTEQVDQALGAGAKYIVAPGLNPDVVEYCLKKSIPVTPGVATPSDVEQALALGLEVVKFFPAEAAGGVDFLKAMSAPYKGLRFIPTGGIDDKNLLSYLRLPSVLACGGSWMVKSDLIADGKFDTIRDLTRAAVQTMLGFHLRHVGINGVDEPTATADATAFGELVGMPVRDAGGALFVGVEFEFLKRQFLGTHGHIAISTNFIDRAVAYCERRGYRFRPETRNEKNGVLQTVYFEKEFAGFAVHLIQV